MAIRGAEAHNDNIKTPPCRAMFLSVSPLYEGLKYSICADDMDRLAECVLKHYRNSDSIPMPICVYDDECRLTDDERDIVHERWNTRHKEKR